MREIPVTEVEVYVFSLVPYQRRHRSFLGGLFRKILPYLNKGTRAVEKEALHAGINVIDDVENNKPFEGSEQKSTLRIVGNLKRKK